MEIRKAVITAAAPNQRNLPLQTLIDRDGREKTVLRILLEEVRAADVDEICVIVSPGVEDAYTRAAGDRNVRFIEQPQPRGYAHAVHCALPFTGGDPFLHLVGDHLYVAKDGTSSTRRLVQVAQEEDCAVSAVQATRESLLPLYGAIGGQRLSGKQDLFRVEKVIEKPTPTEAEQSLTISGLRSGHYLCFFGMHVLTPRVMEILDRELANPSVLTTLSSVLTSWRSRNNTWPSNRPAAATISA